MTEHDTHTRGARREPEVLTFAEARTAVVRGRDIPSGELAAFFDASFGALAGFLKSRALSPVGPAFALYPRLPAETTDLEIGFAIDHPLVGDHTTDSGIVVSASRLPGGPAATVSHVGPYDALGDAWRGLLDWASRNGHAPGLPFWEVYVTEPSPAADPAALRTDLFLPVEAERAASTP